ncbi:hypothetical protein P171DRAFT_442547 [Karstenula rhodostoma CBS 690.94]|uniref:Uncharacterized protein n=1 Tax=Karstenula rhodostoma CBS 690.94 TaxID=1392251 RepID=A0A9P4UD99_9PLEO|nr:hypothetical protein P171DRAFT_442547 [Karstenula rhodostoma CBS 690.94]
MTREEDIWTRWGRYTNEAAIKAAPNHDEIILDLSGRIMFAVHPVPARYLEDLNLEERRMLRQHLDYLLHDGAQDDFERAASETLTNLNTLGNTGRPRIVQFNSEVEFDDGTRYRTPLPDDRPGDGFFNDPAPSASLDAGHPRGSASPAPWQPPLYQDEMHISADRLRDDRTQPSRPQFNRPPAFDHAPPVGATEDYYNASLPPEQYPGFAPGPLPTLARRTRPGPREDLHNGRAPRSALRFASIRPRLNGPTSPDIHIVCANPARRDDGYDMPARKSVPIRHSNAHDHYALPEDDSRPFYSQDGPSNSHYSGAGPHLSLHSPYTSAFEDVPRDWAGDSDESFTALQKRPRMLELESATRRLPRDVMDDDEQLARNMQKQFEDEAMARELQENLHMNDRQDEYAFANGYDTRVNNGGYEEPLPRGRSRDRHRSEHNHRGEDRHRSDDRHRRKDRHRSEREHRDDDNHRDGRHDDRHDSSHERQRPSANTPRRRSLSRYRPSNTTTDPYTSPETRTTAPIPRCFGPFHPSLIANIIRNGTRSEFFEALNTLHPEEAPKRYRIHRTRNAERTSRHRPAIEVLLKNGSVRDVHMVFGEENVGRVFKALGREVGDRKEFW